MSMKESRYNEMVGVQRKTQLEFEKFRIFCSSSLNRFTTQEGESSFAFKLLEEKMYDRTPLLNAYFTRKAFDYLIKGFIDDEVEDIYAQVLPFVMEATTTIQYYNNQILDHKAGVNTPELINNNLILNNLLRECLWGYLEATLPSLEFNTINKHLRLILRMVDVGQLTEKKNNLFSNYRDNVYAVEWNEGVLMHLDQKVIADVKGVILDIAPELTGSTFLDWYLKRIFFSGAFIYPQTTRMILELLGKNAENHHELLHFSGIFGMLMQIINDVTDLVPSEVSKGSIGKHRTDAFSDLKTQNITLPLLIHLENQKGGLIREKLEQSVYEFTETDEMNILKELFSTECIEKTKKIGKGIAHKARALLDLQNPNTFLFKDMCNIADFNQPYKQLAKFEHQLR